VLAAIVCATARNHVPAMLLGSLLLLVVLAVARFGGILYALPVGVMTILAFDWYFLPPLRELGAATVLVGGLFLVISVIVGAAVTTRAGRRAVASERARGDLAAEQAALRRVATLVASGARPAEVFAAVADELGRLIGADATFFSRVDHLSGEDGEPEGDITVVGSYGRVTDDLPVGFRTKLQSGTAMTAALRAGSPVRITGEALATGPFGAIADKLGIRAAVATSVVVGGRHWGVSLATSREDFPADTEARMADFMELAATAIANAQAEQKIRELADTQASLRRLAMLVARGEPRVSTTSTTCRAGSGTCARGSGPRSRCRSMSTAGCGD